MCNSRYRDHLIHKAGNIYWEALSGKFTKTCYRSSNVSGAVSILRFVGGRGRGIIGVSHQGPGKAINS
jgi:hypothetical protein